VKKRMRLHAMRAVLTLYGGRRVKDGKQMTMGIVVGDGVFFLSHLADNTDGSPELIDLTTPMQQEHVYGLLAGIQAATLSR
jgi:hypothetical protein